MSVLRSCAALAFGILVVTAVATPSCAVVSLGVGYDATLSPDGRFLFFLTDGSDSTGQTRTKRDLVLGTSVPAPLPALPTSNIRGYPAVTPSGRYIAFESADPSIVPDDTNGQFDVFVLDSVTSAVSRESLTNAGQEAVGGLTGSGSPSMSDDGRYVVFVSTATNLVAGDTNGPYADVFVRDRCVSNGTAVLSCTPSTQLVSYGPGGVQADGDCDLRSPYGAANSISADGRYVAFSCSPTAAGVGAFAPGHSCSDPLGCTGVYVRDRCISNGTLVPACSPSTELVSLGPGGAFPNADSDLPVISGDGTRVVYDSFATDIVAEAPSQTEDIFLYDRNTHATQRLTTPPASGSLLAAGEPSVSGDGLQVAYRLPQSPSDATMSLWADCAVLQPVCGDGILVPGCEECDDGNLVDGDGCDSNCTFTRCGNHVVTAGEQCDDGNFVDGDGCDSNCTITACGNDIRTAGEACDDGNVTPGDGCSATCTIEPGELTAGGAGRADCEHEWYPFPQPPKAAKGIPKTVLTCRDDDPTCDLDGTIGDRQCVIRLALCVNVTDPRFVCTPTDVATVDLTSPKADNPTDPIADFNRGAIGSALEQLGGGFTGHCTKPPVNLGNACLENADCDDVGGDGQCSKPVYVFSPAVTATNLCSDFVDVVVPLKQSSTGLFVKGTVKIKPKAFPSNDPITLKPRKADSDALTLVCTPGA